MESTKGLGHETKVKVKVKVKGCGWILEPIKNNIIPSHLSPSQKHIDTNYLYFLSSSLSLFPISYSNSSLSFLF